MLRRLALAALLCSTGFFGAARLFDVVTLSWRLHAMPRDQRRAVLFGSWDASARRLAASIPADAAVDMVMVVPESRDLAVLGGAILQPRDCRFFDGWDGWRARRRAEFFHDARAANAPNAVPPPAARYVVAVDPREATPFRLVR